jgi:hypothetical protein
MKDEMARMWKQTVVAYFKIVRLHQCVYLLITNSVALVRDQTIPTERPPLVGEVSANFCG